MKNKVLMCNTVSSIFFTFGLMGQWTFMPKYMETQFYQSASTAALISGDRQIFTNNAIQFGKNK
jgi:solute carrier organic anion transporter family, member 5A